MEREEYLAVRRFRYQKNKDRIAFQNKAWYLKNKEISALRKKEWKEKNIDKHKNSTKTYNSSQEVKEKRKAWRLENKELLNLKQRERRRNRSDGQMQKEKGYRKKYNNLHKEEIKEYHKSRFEIRRETKKEYHSKKYRADVQYKLLHNLRSRIKNIIKRKAKDVTTTKLLGCTLGEFQIHIESKFINGMCWSQILDGSIHIDHIIPCASFDLTEIEEQKKCFHFTNLQPLWALDNLKKGAKCSIR